MAENVSYDVFSAMQTDAPIKKYRKTILGKVAVMVWNSFQSHPETVFLYGRPEKANTKSTIAVFSEKEDVFFKRQNAVHFKNGTIIPMKVDEVIEEKGEDWSQWTDEKVLELVNSRFFKLDSILKKCDSEYFILRILEVAEEEEKSEKVLNHIRERLNELQTRIK